MRAHRAIVLASALLAAGSAAAASSAAVCPQPRFTGKAPSEYYERRNPLEAADTRAAERVFRGDGRGVSCATCHGASGDGRGELSDQFSPPPRNFRCAQTVNGIPDGQLFWIIRYGSPGTSMPAHPQLSETQLWQLVAYLRQLAR
jgi:mono/diheme cytochrome c family protein